MASINHQGTVACDAAALIERHHGRAVSVASAATDSHIRAGDIDAALQMDRVRRVAERLLYQDGGAPPSADQA